MSRERANAAANQLHQCVYDQLVALWRTAEINGLVLEIPVADAEGIVTDAVGQFFVDRLYGQGADLREARHRVEDFWDIAEEADRERGDDRRPPGDERPQERERE